MEKVGVEYTIHYNMYHADYDKFGYIIKDKTCKSIKELQDFIKENIRPKDKIKYIGKREYYKYNLQEFMNIQE